MSKSSTLTAERRDTVGTSASRKLRAAGKLPAVVYGHGEGTAHVVVNHDQAWTLLQERAHTVELRFEGATQTCLIHDAEFDVGAERLVHLDLLRVSADELVEVEVQIKLVGTSKGEKAGGSVDFSLHNLEIRCIPGNIPEFIELNVEEMEMGDVKHARDLVLPPGVELRTDPDAGVVTIHHPADADEPAEGAEGEGAAEPELIRPERGDGEEDGD